MLSNQILIAYFNWIHIEFLKVSILWWIFQTFQLSRIVYGLFFRTKRWKCQVCWPTCSMSLIIIQGFMCKFKLISNILIPVCTLFFEHFLLLFETEVFSLFTSLQCRVVANLWWYAIDFLFKLIEMGGFQRWFGSTFKLIPLKFWLWQLSSKCTLWCA